MKDGVTDVQMLIAVGREVEVHRGVLCGCASAVNLMLWWGRERRTSVGHHLLTAVCPNWQKEYFLERAIIIVPRYY